MTICLNQEPFTSITQIDKVDKVIERWCRFEIKKVNKWKGIIGVQKMTLIKETVAFCIIHQIVKFLYYSKQTNDGLNID